MKLGRGSYGEVVSRDGEAVKKFKKPSHLIQEYIACRYLSDARNIVVPRGISIPDLELRMVLYKTTLRRWMESNHSASYNQKKRVAHSILLGLTEIHMRDLVHGDIKPGNILMDDNYEAHIGDLGFVSSSPYAKVERTAAFYRDPEIKKGPEHDMFSFGIVLLELFGNYRLKEQLDYHDIHELAKKHVDSKKVRDLIIELTDKKHKKRPTSLEVLRDFFEDHKYGYHKKSRPQILELNSESLRRKILNDMKEVADKYSIHRLKKGNKAISTYIVREGIDEKDHGLYSGCMMIILSSVFGKSGFSVDQLSEKYPEKTINRVLTDLVKSDYVLGILFG